MRLAFAALLALATIAPAQAPLSKVPFERVKVTDAFFKERIRINRNVTVAACLDQCEKTGRIHNLEVAGGLAEGKFEGQRYNDSDVYKTIEGAAYALHDERDAALEARIDHIVDAIAAAQRDDGYVNAYYTLVKPDERWQNIAHGHELYCAGHLIEAAIAYSQATGKDKLLGVATRFADLIDREFGPGKRLDPPGHEELELALLKLAAVRQEPRYARLARFFLEQRGSKARARLFGEYAQDHLPIREQREPVGHAVRAMYLYCGMTDLLMQKEDPDLRAALTAIWDNLQAGKTYITGGIGTSAKNEGFTEPYDLPNDGAYAETCAAIGLALWSHRMYLLTGQTRYADVLERALYNGLLCGVSLAGDRFHYANPLASEGKHERREWFNTACCPTNVVRYVPAIGERIWARRDDVVYLVLPIASETTVALPGGEVALRLEASYPWEGILTVHVDPAAQQELELRVRVPGWCERRPFVAIGDGEAWPVDPVDGYVCLRRVWKKGDRVRIELPMWPRRVHADPRVAADVGRVAIQCGPLVYCFEGIDHGGHARNLVLPPHVALRRVPDATFGMRVEADGLALTPEGEARPTKLSAIPFFAWDNRGPGEMVVWIPEQ